MEHLDVRASYDSISFSPLAPSSVFISLTDTLFRKRYSTIGSVRNVEFDFKRN